MFIIRGQDRDLLINFDRIHTLSVYKVETRENEKPQYRILAWYGNSSFDCWGIGDYESEERAKEIINDIFNAFHNSYRIQMPAMIESQKEKWFRCRSCGVEFPESEFGSITEDEQDVCPACGSDGCCEEMENSNDD